MRPSAPRARALLLAALAALLLVGRLALPREPAGPSSDALDEVAAPPDSAVALLAGAFRPIAADILWLRIELLLASDRKDEVAPLARVLLALDPRSEAAWYVLASAIGTDAPAFEQDPALVWRWKRQGLLLLEEGARRNPGSWFLRHRAGLILEAQVLPRSGLPERFREDRAVNPSGESAAEAALRWYREALSRPGRPRYVEESVLRLERRVAEERRR